MSEPYLAEIKIVGFNFAPRNWAFCDGQLLPIAQNQSLYSLLGTNYGGDGRTSFALPDLRGRVPIHVGPGHNLGQKSGTETETLTTSEMPQHDHELKGTNSNGDAPISSGTLLAAYANGYRDGTDATALNAASVQTVGAGQAHENMQPYLALRFCIALQGLFPPRN